MTTSTQQAIKIIEEMLQEEQPKEIFYALRTARQALLDQAAHQRWIQRAVKRQGSTSNVRTITIGDTSYALCTFLVQL
jgi:hypothetical protein